MKSNRDSNFEDNSETRHKQSVQHSSVRRDRDPRKGDSFSTDSEYSSASGEGYQNMGRGFQAQDRLDYGSDNYTSDQFPTAQRDFSASSPSELSGQQYRNQDDGRQQPYRGSNGGQFNRSISGYQGTGRGPKGYKRSDDRLREDVCEALSNHYSIDASEVEVNVTEGVLTLSGHVENRHMKRMIEDVVDHVSGITDVNNEIKVQSQTQSHSQSNSTTLKPSSSSQIPKSASTSQNSKNSQFTRNSK